MSQYKVLSCGSNGLGQLGIGSDDDQDTVQECKFEGFNEISMKPVSIACGGNHTLILFESGQVFASGDNTYGQCGVDVDNSRSKYLSFVKIPGSWVQISCGWEFSVLVNSRNEVFVCGNGLKGELGLGKKTTSTREPTKVDINFPSKIKAIKSALNHTVIQLTNGEFYGWGVSRKGQLGVDREKITWVPAQINWGLNLNLEQYKFVLGRDFTVLYNDEFHLFGTQNKISDMIESCTYSKRQLSIWSMWSSIHIIDADGKVVFLGNNSHGQKFPSTCVSNSQLFCTGSEHGLTKLENKVYAWGWGEHGNCGVLKKEDEVVFSNLNEIYQNDNIIDLACGCATSWIITKN
ncbi:protein KTI13 [[Candida] anglica]